MFHEEAPQYPGQRKNIMLFFSTYVQMPRSRCAAGCFCVVFQSFVCCLILVGDERVAPSELRRRYSAREIIDGATRAWTILIEGFACALLSNKTFNSGSPSGGWKVVKKWLESREAAQQRIRLNKFEAQ